MSRIDEKKDTTVLILAAGKARRMNGVKKQLLRIGDDTVTGRVIRQAKMRGCEPFVVSNDEEILAVANSWMKPFISDVTCETFISTEHLWKTRTIVLLGDVVYSKKCMDDIFACTDPMRVFGDTWEVYAVTFAFKQRHKVMRALNIGATQPLGKLRFFYRAYCGLPLDTKEQEGVAPDDKVFWYVSDWTRDIDMLDEYHNTIRELVTTGKLKREI